VRSAPKTGLLLDLQQVELMEDFIRAVSEKHRTELSAFWRTPESPVPKASGPKSQGPPCAQPRALTRGPFTRLID
jgi:hypothetical protein